MREEAPLLFFHHQTQISVTAAPTSLLLTSVGFVTSDREASKGARAKRDIGEGGGGVDALQRLKAAALVAWG